VVMGHELCGRIESVPDGSKLKVGDAVMVDPHFTCEACQQCKSDRDHLCPKMGFVGASGGACGGGLSEYVAVDDNMVHRLPDTIHLEDAAVIEPLTVAHHSIKTSGADFANDKISVLISGGGPIGYAMALTLRAHGASMIILSEPTLKRRSYAEGIVNVIVDPLTDNVGDKCRQATGGVGVDIVFDCAGSKRASDDAFDAIKIGGRFINVAMWSSSVWLRAPS
jgi:threonine dehydrogenase-like Zn-dependent dehydrogenase